MLQFTQDNEAQKTQDGALQEYLTQIGDLLFGDDTPVNEKTHLLVRMHTLTIFRRLDGSRKGSTLMFQYGLRLLDRQPEENKPTIDLLGADLSEAHLSSRDLNGANLSGTNLSKADLRETILIMADLRDTILSEAKLHGADLRCADLRNAESLTQEQLEQAKGNRVTQVPKYLSYPTKWGFDSRGVRLPKADLKNADLSSGVLHSADLQEADLEEANLKGASLQDADLRGAKLQDANLQGADLQDADLQGADLQQANLRGAILERASFLLANLKGAEVTDDQLASTWSLRAATMPNGQKYEDRREDKEGSGKDLENE